ncbi:hypothetical protein E2C01_021060 [Portunus trituberculatus]|uniref:Uncharacterized protein n=1 Tax=Portunus trituberculatus TaxID=210409 RepID=A0A5B7E3N3_PORTR|nr:hypothetical protein [Portunus trituberculatus]
MVGSFILSAHIFDTNYCFEITSNINHGHHGEPKVWERDRVVLTYSSLMGEVVDETEKGEFNTMAMQGVMENMENI